MSARENDRQAAEWLAREDRGLTADEEQMLQAWMMASYRHKVAYLRAKSVWQRADRLAALRRPQSASADGPLRRSISGALPWLAAAGVVLAIGLGAGIFAVNKFESAHYYATDI